VPILEFKTGSEARCTTLEKIALGAMDGECGREGAIEGGKADET